MVDYLRLPRDLNDWWFFVIDIPVDAEGNGPVTVAEASKIVYEVWDREFNTHGSFPYLRDAVALAVQLNHVN